MHFAIGIFGLWKLCNKSMLMLWRIRHGLPKINDHVIEKIDQLMRSYWMGILKTSYNLFCVIVFLIGICADSGEITFFVVIERV